MQTPEKPDHLHSAMKGHEVFYVQATVTFQPL